MPITPLFNRINVLRDLRRRLVEAIYDNPHLGLDRQDVSTIDMCIAEMMEREKTLLTTRAALEVSIGLRQPHYVQQRPIKPEGAL